MNLSRSFLIAASILFALPAAAQEAQGDPSQGTGPLPTNVAPVPTPICTDRPTKASVACTVPAGNVQIESDVLSWTRMDDAGTRTDTILFTNPTLKVGVGTHTDVELNIAPYETVRTRDAGSVDTEGGLGDLYLRVKQRLTADEAKTQVSLIPYVKVPTARQAIGNGQWEGGIVGAANIPLPAHFTLTFGPEIDILADDEGGGHHVGLVSLVNVSHPVTKDINAYVEFWNQQELAPGGTIHQYSIDLAGTYQLKKTLQLDAGINIGLNRETCGTQLYLGISKRF